MSGLRWFLLGVLLGAVVLWFAGRRQYASLRQFADSTRVASAEQVAALHHHSDSLEGVVAELGKRRTTITTKAAADTGSNDPAVLKAVARSLFEALKISDAMLQAERASKDSALAVVATLNRNIVGLVTRVDRLGGLPTWAKVGLGGLAVAGAAYGGFKAGQASRAPAP